MERNEQQQQQQNEKLANSLSPTRGNSPGGPINHPNISAQHLASLSQRRPTSAAPCTVTLQTSLKREMSNGPPNPSTLMNPHTQQLQHSRQNTSHQHKPRVVHHG